jgi:activator of HSP90 ATPase
MKVKTIKQEIMFDSSPHEIYELLMDSEKHASITGDQAIISRDVGGKISAGDGYIDGENLDLIPDKKIVQKWRGSDWPERHYSTATFELEKLGNQTKLMFVQTDVPEEQYEMISQGWYDYYWEPMKSMLKK